MVFTRTKGNDAFDFKGYARPVDVQDTDPVTIVWALRPVCPNCHAMLHRKQPPYEIEEMKALM